MRDCCWRLRVGRRSIGFVGLVAPFFGRQLSRGHPAGHGSAAAIGAVLLTLADLVVRSVHLDRPIPVGVVTACSENVFYGGADEAAGGDGMTSLIATRSRDGRLSPPTSSRAGELVALVGTNGGGKTSRSAPSPDRERGRG